MRILLAQNSQYYPAHGGGDKSNRLLMEALAARGHQCRAVARISVFGQAGHAQLLRELAVRGVTPSSSNERVVAFERQGVQAHVVTNTNLRGHFVSQIEAFAPDVILTSSDDPAQLLLDAALRAERSRVVYLARAPLALPFGPDSAFPSATRTARIRSVDRVVGVSQYVADYVRRYAGIDAVHVPISLVEPQSWPELGRFDNELVVIANPCAVKGIGIFLALANEFPGVRFAAVPTWGTNAADRAALASLPNVQVLDPVDDMDELFCKTKVLLVPSLWAEARSRIVLEAMLRGVPVIASNVGGIPEAKMGVPYLIPVNPIQKYETRVDDQMVPVADVPPQDIRPWRNALNCLLSDRAHYEDIARRSREAALTYAGSLTIEPFERLLSRTLPSHTTGMEPGDVGQVSDLPSPRRAGTLQGDVGNLPHVEPLTPEKRRLLALRLRKRAPASAWFPGADAIAPPRLFWFPHAGGGAQSVPISHACPVRLPGRESRLAEASFDRMEPLVAALADAIEPYLTQPFAFFGHSMGAAIAFELARVLQRRGLPLPRILIASAARAPQYRRNHVPPPAPGEDEFIAELRRLEGIPAEVLADPSLMRALLPVMLADAALYRNYVYRDESPLDVPIRAYGGLDDPNVRAEHLEAWREQTTQSFAVRSFPGGHFYLQTFPAAFRAALETDLT